METLTVPFSPIATATRLGRCGPIIVATDGRAQSDSALVMGEILAEAHDDLRIVAVLPAMPVIPEAPQTISHDLDAARRSTLRREAVAQASRVWRGDYEVELREGDPASEIAGLAHGAGARLIVAGLGRHRVTERVFGEETVLRLMRMSDIPVYAAATGVSHAPRRVVVAVDFSESGLRAAQLALDVAAFGATVFLAHVAPRDSALHEWKEWGTTYKLDAANALAVTRTKLSVPRGTFVEQIVLQGDAATEILAFATSVNADLIATGSHGRGYVSRLLIGSVTTRIVRCSTCSVLAVPHAAAAQSPSGIPAHIHQQATTQVQHSPDGSLTPPTVA